MTAIAYRNRVLAGDSLTEWSDVDIKELSDIKVVKEANHLIGMAGDKCPPMSHFVKWYFGNRKRPMSKKYKFVAVVVKPDAVVEIWDESFDIDYTTLPYFAIGSGTGVCMGAMWKGASAEEAVQAAIDHAPGVGGHVTVVRLDDEGQMGTTGT